MSYIKLAHMLWGKERYDLAEHAKRVVWRPLAPGKMSILHGLVNGESEPYTALKRKAEIQDPSMIKYLRELLADRLIEKDPSTRAYRITDDGLRETLTYDFTYSLFQELMSHTKSALRDRRVIVFDFPNSKRDEALRKRIRELLQELDGKKLLARYWSIYSPVRGHSLLDMPPLKV
jgi:predicted transcriptional regulator